MPAVRADPRPSPPLRTAQRSTLRATLASRQRHVSLCETLDRVLNKGAVIAGDVVISVAGIDLIYLGLSLTVTSVETVRAHALKAEDEARIAQE
jgi:gas vesicle structural protein